VKALVKKKGLVGENIFCTEHVAKGWFLGHYVVFFLPFTAIQMVSEGRGRVVLFAANGRKAVSIERIRASRGDVILQATVALDHRDLASQQVL